jgi:hypothetical protein
VLGLVCFAKCHNENEVGELTQLYEDVQKQYGNTMYDARLVIFGVAPPPDQQAPPPPEPAHTLPASESAATLTNEDKENSNVTAKVRRALTF